jgi:hypothetical protein
VFEWIPLIPGIYNFNHSFLTVNLKKYCLEFKLN